MPLKKPFVNGDGLDGHDTLEALHLDHLVDHQKRVAMRQKFLDLVDVELRVYSCFAHGQRDDPLLTWQTSYYRRFSVSGQLFIFRAEYSSAPHFSGASPGRGTISVPWRRLRFFAF